MRDFKEFVVWRRSHQLAIDIYRATQEFPREEAFGQVSQIRRAAASIPTNIAEGCGRQSNAEFSNFLNIASGSASEVEYELLLAKELGYINDSQYSLMSKEIRAIRSMLSTLMTRLKERKNKSINSSATES